MYVLENLEPKKIFNFFEELTRIPRGSGNEKEVSDYLVNFGKERNLEVIQDKAYNVIIKKPGTAGYENSPAVILQGHMDVVCEKNQDTVHDFEKDPVKLVIDGDFIKGTGTTLGADNGVALALAMGILDSSDLSHPPIEALFTVDEEVGMGGAMALDPAHFKAKRIINLDVGPEGSFCVGCAGGIRHKFGVPVEWVETPAGLEAYNLKIRGLKGGHSGGLIHLELGNSNKLLGRALDMIAGNCSLIIAHVSGGSKDNAIPREADALIAVKSGEVDKLNEIVKELDSTFKKELRASDPDVVLSLEKAAMPAKVFSDKTTDTLIKAYMLLPCGLIHKSMEIEGLTETSTNLGVVVTNENEVMLTNATRSSVVTRRTQIRRQIAMLAEVLGVNYAETNEYPAWEYNPTSHLRDVAAATYEELTGKKAEIKATHGGLECGVFCEKMPGVDVIATGPTAFGAHTPEEKLSISSLARTWEFVKKLLENLKD